MNETFAPRAYIPLQANVTFDRPPEPPELVHRDSPAIKVMTDFNRVRPVTVRPDVPIDVALEQMKSAGVRLLLVIDAADAIIGVISAKDIQGERPVKIVEQSRVQRGDITVQMVMTPQPEVTALDVKSVRDARVGHIIETLHRLERQHILVVRTDTGRQQVCGMFSTSEINKRLSRGMAEEVPAAHSLAEMVHEIG